MQESKKRKGSDDVSDASSSGSDDEYDPKASMPPRGKGSKSKIGAKTIDKADSEKLKMPEGRCARTLFVIFFPIHVLAYYCIPNIRIKPNLSKVLLTCITLLLLQIVFAVLILIHVMVLGRAFRLKESILGLFTGFISSLGYMIYAFSIRNHSKDYNYFITAQEYSIFRVSFLFGLVQVIDQIILHSKPALASKLVPLTYIGTIMGVNILAIIYNSLTKGVWHWQVGIVAWLILLGNIALTLIY